MPHPAVIFRRQLHLMPGLTTQAPFTNKRHGFYGRLGLKLCRAKQLFAVGAQHPLWRDTPIWRSPENPSCAGAQVIERLLCARKQTEPLK
jgi:hypothetical protein